MARVDADRTKNAGKTHFHWASTASPVVGQWELVEKAAEGWLTEIYLARPAGRGDRASTSYAVKILKAEWEADPRAIETLRREALAGRLVSHPNLISVLAAGTQAAPYYVVMPWLRGGTLEARLAPGSAEGDTAAKGTVPISAASCHENGDSPRGSRGGGVEGVAAKWGQSPLGIAEALWISRQVADALAALEAAGWMHGDVKPSNIFLSPEGHVTLLDLGFARRTDRNEPTVEPSVAGTENYLAPEAFVPWLRVDIRSDLYSLGMTLVEMLSGRPPFDARDAAELAKQHREARPARQEEVVRRLPADAGMLLRQMLAKDPLRRPQSPREAVARLVRAEIATLSRG